MFKKIDEYDGKDKIFFFPEYDIKQIDYIEHQISEWNIIWTSIGKSLLKVVCCSSCPHLGVTISVFHILSSLQIHHFKYK